jgi:predicted permease
LVPAAFAFAGTLGPAIAGHLVSSYGYMYLLIFATITACIPMMYYSSRKLSVE